MRLDDLVGQQLDNFLVKERIGKGGMATVFRAYQPNVNRDIALKVIDLSDEQSHAEEDFHRRFAHEAEIIASLEHPYIVPVFDYGLRDDLAFLAMRLLKGGSLMDIMRDRILPIERTVELFGQIAKGLAFAHGRGIIHRDLKPSNILLDDEGNACLTDFGLAKLISGSNDITKTGNIVGTPAYMSPEQLRGEALDHRSDIYSLGVILYQMLTGRPPFEGSSTDVISVIYKHLEKQPDLPSKHNPHLNSEMDAVVMKSLSKKPDERYDNAGDMLNALRVAAGFKPSTGSFPVATVPRVKHEFSEMKKRTQQRLLLGAGLAVLLIAGVLATLVFANQESATKVLSPPTVLSERRVNAANIFPSEEEIALANQHLDDEGFVALITCNRTSQYHAGIAREIVEDAGRDGLQVQIYDADNNPNRQVTLIEQARADGASGLILCPLDLSIVDGTLADVDEANLPLVLFSGGDNHYGGVMMRGDSYTLGYIPGIYAGRLIREELGGEANVVVLDYSDLPDIIRRADGLNDGILELAPNAIILGRYRGGTEENGYNAIQGLIEDGVDFNVIASINDVGAYGAIRAMEEAGFEPDSVIIVSVDAEAQAQEYIRDGYFMRGSVAVARQTSAQAMVNSMVKLLAGSTIPEDIVTMVGESDIVTQESLLEAEAPANP